MDESVTAGHIAGVLVVVAPGASEVVARLGREPGVETHVDDTARGRLVVTIDGPTAAAVRATHEAIAGLPGVLAAHLVCHLADDGAVASMRAGGAS